jgi:hypothetical protein
MGDNALNEISGRLNGLGASRPLPAIAPCDLFIFLVIVVTLRIFPINSDY